MSFPLQNLLAEEFPPLLREIPQPPTDLNYRGQLPPPDLKLLAIVGSRKYTSYGKEVVEHLVAGLKNHPIGIVSGLALGIDGLAHEAALRHRLYTLAIPGGGLDDSVLYPRQHTRLASQILEAGGGLLSEFDPFFTPTKWSFTQRNRLVAGISNATLIIEAAEQSGTLITARLTVDYNRELLVVPGNIFSKNMAGNHQFLKLGATPVTEAADILAVFGIDAAEETAKTLSLPSLDPLELKVIALLHEPQERDLLIRQLDLPTPEAAALLMQMEMKDLITLSNNHYRSNF